MRTGRPRRWFRLSVPDDLLRSLTREQYRAVRRWLRNAERLIAEELERNPVPRA
jgi:hypothetical protein